MSDSPVHESLDRLTAPLYFLAAATAASGIFNFMVDVIPLRPQDIAWRFAAARHASDALFPLLAGIAIAMVVSVWAGHPRVQRALAGANLVAMLALVLAFALYTLDSLELHANVPVEQEPAWEAAATLTGAQIALTAVAMFWLAAVGFRLHRRTGGLKMGRPPAHLTRTFLLTPAKPPTQST